MCPTTAKLNINMTIAKTLLELVSDLNQVCALWRLSPRLKYARHKQSNDVLAQQSDKPMMIVLSRNWARTNS
jgi:hypothetical protein